MTLAKRAAELRKAMRDRQLVRFNRRFDKWHTCALILVGGKPPRLRNP